VPVFKYFLTVGSLLCGLLYYASTVIEPASLPFNVAQTSGLPKPFKAPVAEPPNPSVAAAEAPKPSLVAAKIEPSTQAKNRKAMHKHKPTQIARPAQAQERYAGYPPNAVGSIW
jgi:hypothetical protein